jgi:outer membrane protein, heavy metal efflux system
VVGAAWADCATASQDVAASIESPLTLERSIAIALDRSYPVRRAGALLGEAQANAQTADRATPSDPQVEAWTGHRNGLGNSLDATASDSSTDLGIRFSQEIWIAGEAAFTRRVATAQASSAQRQLEYLRSVTAAQVRNAFLQLLIAKEALATANQAVDLARATTGFTRHRLDRGDTNRLDLNAAIIEEDKARASSSIAAVDLVRARLALTQLLAISPRSNFEITGTLTAPSLSLPDETALITSAIERRQDLAAAAADVEAARDALQLTHRQLTPNVVLSGAYASEGKEDVATVGFTVSLPLSRQSSQGKVSAAQARLTRAEVDLDELRVGVERDVVTALQTYSAARDQFQAVDKQTLSLAAENVELTRRALEAGKIGSPALAAAEATYLEVRSVYLGGLRALTQAAMDLELATGGILVVAAQDRRSE